MQRGSRLLMAMLLAASMGVTPLTALADDGGDSLAASNSLSVQSEMLEQEDNDSPMQAKYIEIGTTYRGDMKSTADQDWFLINLPYDAKISVEVEEGTPAKKSRGWVVEFYNASEYVLASDSAKKGDKTVYTTDKTVAGAYYMKVTEDTSGGHQYTRDASYLITAGYTDVDISGAKISVAEAYHTGKPLTPTVSVVLGGTRLLLPGVDYDVAYSDNVYVGKGLVTVTGKGMFAGTAKQEFTINPGFETPDPSVDESIYPMYRMYNPYTGEHFFTASVAERNDLKVHGWKAEGIGWYAPDDGDPVYRLYNPYSGEHHYTLSARENAKLVRLGWKSEGVGWYSEGTNGVPVYRLYNPWTDDCYHTYTVSKKERDVLVKKGWRKEGIGWYGVKVK